MYPCVRLAMLSRVLLLEEKFRVVVLVLVGADDGSAFAIG